MKKTLSFILAAAITVCSFATSVMAAETTKVKLTDVTESTKYANEILTLVELGIINGYEDSTFKADNEISRAEFTKVIAVAMGASDKSSGSTTLTDMENHWAKPYVIAAQGNNIINGFEDNTFRPDDKVTYEQAVKMLVCALRYNKTAEGRGGWPDGYLSTGSDLGVTDEVIVSDASAPTTRGIVAKLVYNSLDVELADLEDGKPTEIIFMNQFLKKGKVEGKVVGIADDLTADCTESISKNEIAILDDETGKIVRIDFTTLYPDKSDLISNLGQDVVAYYDLSGRDGANKLVIFNSSTTKKESVEIFSNDVISYSNGKLKYYNKSGKSETVDFDTSTVTVVYNKKVVSTGAAGKLANWLDPDSNNFYYGNATFVDNGADNSVDVVEIMNYDTVMAVRAPSSSDYKLTNKIKFDSDYTPVKTPLASVVLDPDRLSYLNITNASGTKIQPTGISANSVALIAESEDADSYTVIVSTETVSGTIDYYSEVDHQIKIAGKEYYINDFCIDYFKQEGYGFNLGQKGKFYVDALGTVTYGELTASSDTSTYAYIVTSLYDDSTNKGSIRVYVPLKGYMTYTLDDKIRLDGSSNVTAEEAAETLRDNIIYFDNDANIYGDGEVIAESNAYQLAILELEGSTVTEITTMQNETLGSNDNMSKLVRFNDLAKIKYTGSNNFNNTFYINSDTKVIFVPQDRKETSKYKKPSFSIGGSYYVEAYNVDSSKYADVVLVYGSSASGTSVAHTTPIYIMAEAPFADASGEDMVTKMSIYNDTGVLSDVVINENQTAAKSYDAGDIFQYVLDGDSEAIGFQRRLAYADVEPVLDADTDNAADGDIFFDWTDSKFKFETTQTLNYGGIKYAGVYMYNLIKINDKSLVATQDGFKYDEASGRFSLVEGYTTELINAGSAKFLIYDEDKDEITNVDESGNELTIESLIEADDVDIDCSKIAVIRRGAEAIKTIVIYR